MSSCFEGLDIHSRIQIACVLTRHCSFIFYSHWKTSFTSCLYNSPSMAARSASPTHAFDPTPALEHNPVNFSPLTHSQTQNMASSVDFRGVHFSDLPLSSALTQARHSIATSNVPLLSPIPSASQLPRHAFQMANPPSGIDFDQYMEINARLRESHELERKGWYIERHALKGHIKILEQQLERKRDEKRRSSNDSSSTSIQSFRSSLQPVAVNGTSRGRISSEPTISAKPVWIGPETTPPVTRVFSNEEDIKH